MMPELAPISAAFPARTTPAELERRYAVVDPGFAARLRTAHTRRFEAVAATTALGDEQLTRDVPNVGEDALDHLDEDGLAKVGTAVEPGMILVGKATPIGGGPLSSEEKLLRAIFGEAAGDLRDTSLRVPPGCFGVVTGAQREPGEEGEVGRARVEVAWERPLDVGDLLLVSGEPVVVAAIRPLGADLAWGDRGSTVTVAKAAMARDVLHARSIGPYSPATQQPKVGRERFGGQRLEPEAVERLAVHAPWVLWEMLTIKADAVTARVRTYEAIVKQEQPDVIPQPAAPAPAVANPGGGAADIFSFFERPVTVAPGEVPAVPPEVVTVLVDCLRALGLELDLRAAEVGASILTADQLRERSHGEVRSPDTVDPRTQQPVLEGLLCPKIFGPTKDYECACGKYRRMKHRGMVCEACGVEVIQSRVRRERFGHVTLATPCLHPLWADEVATLLGLPTDEVREVVAGRRVLHAAGDWAWRTAPGEGVSGGQAVWEALARIDLEALDAIEAGPRADLAAALIRAERPATALMLTVVPVLPPDLRPRGRSTTDLTQLYGAVVSRNARLRRLLELSAPAAIIANEQAQLQVAIDRLMLDAEAQVSLVSPKTRPLAAHVDRLFQRRLFIKPVDFSGVAHLVADPSLPAGECRVPNAMLLELFKPHALGILEARGFATTIKSAKRMVEARRPEALAAIEEASADHPVLLVAGAAIVSRRVRGWDAPAIAVDPITAQRLASPTVTAHVPLMPEAVLDCEQLEDSPSAEARAPARAWLGRARQQGGLVLGARGAALHGERDRLDDPVVALALGRPPAAIHETTRVRVLERDRERRERVWARVEPQPAAPGDSPPLNPHLARSIDELELSVASARVLDGAGIGTIADLCRRTESELLKMKGFGRKQLTEVKQLLAELGLALGMRLD